MHESIVVITESEDGLYRQKWVFEWSYTNLVLCRYYMERRVRAEGDCWQLVQFWDREDFGGYGNWTWIKEKDVPFDDELRGHVIMALVDKITIGKPQDFRKPQKILR